MWCPKWCGGCTKPSFPTWTLRYLRKIEIKVSDREAGQRNQIFLCVLVQLS
jgi:hypothetical protein